MQFDFNAKERKEILEQIFSHIEYSFFNAENLPFNPDLNIDKIRELVGITDLNEGMESHEAIKHVIEGIEKYSVHASNPKYLGLFNPRSNYAGIMADLITAAYNPQLAAWGHAPYPIEVELKLIKEFAVKFGYETDTASGVFTTGGAEANLTAVLCALTNKYPDYLKNGLFALNKKPLIFCSDQAHHSIQKAAKAVGVGFDLVKLIPTDHDLRLNIEALDRELNNLDNSVYDPLMVVGTAGTTGAGSIDELSALKTICKKHHMWFHADAAYGGAAIISSEYRSCLEGIEASDSITFDAHKWMSVPMGASIFLTSKYNILQKTFQIVTDYIPKETDGLRVFDPYINSIQWSRRFIGLKVYLSLLFYGWKGYEKSIDHQIQMGQLLRKRLQESGWSIKNNTILPVVCFSDTTLEADVNFLSEISQNIIAKGKAWSSLYPIKGVPTIRACITNYQTTEKEINEFVKELNHERQIYRSKHLQSAV